MANNFSTDPNCVALYRFESGALTADGKGPYTLTNHNGVTESLADYKEGLCCADLESDTDQFFIMPAANALDDFPFRYVQKASMCLWFKWESTTQGFLAGLSTSPFNFRIEPNGSLSTWIGGSTTWTVATIVTGEWYHLGFTLDGASGNYFLKIVKASDQSVQTKSGVQTAALSNVPFLIGSSSTTATTLTFDGRIDECVLFNDILSEAEIDAIRAGTYSPPPPGQANDFSTDPSCVALWKFEDPAHKGLDSIGANTLDDGATTALKISNIFQEGIHSLFFGASTYYPRITDGNLAANFPLKHTQVAPDFSITCWFRLTASATGTIYLWSKYYPGYSSTIAAIISTTKTIQIAKAIDSTSGRETFTLPGITLENYVWYHLTVAYDYSDKTLYAYLFDEAGNLLSANTVVQASDMYMSSRNFRLNGYETDIGRQILWLDEIAVFNRVISQDEAARICQGTFGSHDPSPSSPPTEIRAIRSDISGNARHMSDSGALPTGNVKGKIGNAAYFSGAGEQLLKLAQAPNLTGDQEFTVAFRMKPHLKSNPAADIFWHFKVGDLEIRAGFAPGQTRAFVSASTPSLSCRTGNIIPADIFSFIAVYFDTSGLYIDVNDSNEAAQAGVHTGIVTPATGIEAGISSTVAMNISIDELGLWVGLNALSEAQRTTLYSGNYGQRPSFS